MQSSHRNTRLFIRVLLALIFGLALLPGTGVSRVLAARQPADALTLQVRDWSPPQNMGLGWFPDIAADPSGTVHLVWASVRKPPRAGRGPIGNQVPSGYDIVNYAAYSQGSGWSSVVDILAAVQRSGTEVTRPNALIDSSGKFHLTFRDTNVYYTSAPVQLAASSRSWSEWHQVNVDQVAYFSDLAVDSNGTLHMVYTENVMSSTCSICYHIFYRYSTDNGLNWSARTDISYLPTGAAKPHILVDDLNHVHVVWEAGSGGSYGQLSGPTSVMHTALFNGSTKWSRPQELVLPGGQGRNIAIGQDGNGHMLVVWLALPEDQMVYQLSTNHGRSWSDPEPIPGIWSGWAAYPARLDDYDLESDSAGNLHLVLAGRLTAEQRQVDLLHLTWNREKWNAPDLIASYTGDVPEWPRLAVALGNQLHVTWFVRDQAHIYDSDEGSDTYTVWTSYRKVPAPSVPAREVPTAVPSSTPTVEQVVVIQTPTPTAPDPSIANSPISADVSASLYSEMDEMKVIALSLIPALAFMFLVVALVRTLRRK